MDRDCQLTTFMHEVHIYVKEVQASIHLLDWSEYEKSTLVGIFRFCTERPIEKKKGNELHQQKSAASLTNFSAYKD